MGTAGLEKAGARELSKTKASIVSSSLSSFPQVHTCLSAHLVYYFSPFAVVFLCSHMRPNWVNVALYTKVIDSHTHYWCSPVVRLLVLKGQRHTFSTKSIDWSSWIWMTILVIAIILKWASWGTLICRMLLLKSVGKIGTSQINGHIWWRSQAPDTFVGFHRSHKVLENISFVIK